MEKFPTLSIGQDSSKYREGMTAGGTVSKKMEGGYNRTRRRYTRRPARTFSVGFTYLSEQDRVTLKAHFERVGSHSEFEWTHPTTGEIIACRYREDEAFEFSYEGVGENKRWGIMLQLEET